MNQWKRVGIAALFISACAQEPGTRSAGLGDAPRGGDGTLCQESWDTPVRLTTGTRSMIGALNARVEGDELVLRFHATTPDWRIGDVYAGVGPRGSSLTWYAANTQPWVTGWLDAVELRIPMSSASGPCGGELKIFIQARVRHTSTLEIRWASAHGSYDAGEYGWYDLRDLCCDIPEDAGVGLDAGVDMDGDGWPVPNDCNDANPDVHPDATETCNGVDDDCDGEHDGELANDWCQLPENQIPHTIIECIGTCEPVDCEEGWAMCDIHSENGCETDLMNDPQNCGGCRVTCAGVCAGGECLEAARSQ
jgi:hypothetical protein